MQGFYGKAKKRQKNVKKRQKRENFLVALFRENAIKNATKKSQKVSL